MIKRFCDICNTELTTKNSIETNLIGQINANDCVLSVELIVAKNGVTNGGDFCNNCILDAVATLDDR